MLTQPARTPIYKAIIRPALFFIGLVFFAFLIIRSWQETQNILRTLNWPLFLLSALIAVADNALFSFLFQTLLTKYNFYIDYPRIGQMYFYGQIAKYIPGRFWSVFYHATFLQRPGVTKIMLFANLDLTAVGMLRNVVIAIALILFYRQAWLAGIVFVLGSLAFWYFSKSCWIARIFQFVTRHLKSSSDNISRCTTSNNNKNILLINVGTWTTYLTANFLLMKAAFNLPVEEAAPYIAYFALAWVVGAISFIVPAGIGIREITFVYLVRYMGQGQVTGIETITAIAIVYRFWLILMELGGLGIGFILSRFKKGSL